MERECLTILLRGTQPVILCPARGIAGLRLRKEYKQPVGQNRLLFISPFGQKASRATVEMALFRNRLVAALADAIVVAHAAPRSKTEQFCREVLAWGKPLFTFDDDANFALMAAGARPMVAAEHVADLFR